MGQKVHPKSFRLATIQDWPSKWLAKKGKNYVKFLKEDTLLREFIEKSLRNTGIAGVEIERSPNSLEVTIKTAKPGLIIGRGGTGIDELRKKIQAKFFGGKRFNWRLSIKELAKPTESAKVIAENIAQEQERRIPYRRSIKRALDQVVKSGAKGVKIMIAGRLNGAEIARTETLSYGKIPLHTLRADIDFGQATAYTTYGTVGVKVWIYKGEVFNKQKD